MRKAIDERDLDVLTAAILDERKHFGKEKEEILAYNDALHTLRVYTKRAELGETLVTNPFGYRTWWLTHDKAVQRASLPIFGPPKPRFIMRPEFLLNYIGLSPSKKRICESYSAIFPTIFGITLSKILDSGSLHTVLTSVRDAHSVDDSRAKAMISEYVDKLKADQIRIYENRF
jgi:hypothetical protein